MKRLALKDVTRELAPNFRLPPAYSVALHSLQNAHLEIPCMVRCGYVVPDPYRVIYSFEYSKGPDKLEELGLQEVSICEFNEGALA